MVNFGRSKSTLNRVPFSQSPYQQSAAPPLPMNTRRRSVRVAQEVPESDEYVQVDFSFTAFVFAIGQGLTLIITILIFTVN